ncbi:MAG: tetratricopeptide repeat protein [Acidobacteriaceae bacterium]|nr:tetratricopeptide repeat protein [Acidobacteriaceae bacterium]
MRYSVQSSWLTNIFVALLVIVGTVFFIRDVWGAADVLAQSNARPQGTVQTPGAAASNGNDQLQTLKDQINVDEKQIEVDEKRLDALRTKTGDVQLLVTILLGLGILYAGAQAIVTNYNLQAMQKALRDEAKQQKTDWDAFQADCRKQFPRFAGMDEVRATILGQLGAMLLTKDSAENLFNRLSVDDRQRVFFHEKSIAGLEFLNLNQTPEDSLKVFRGLGRFYIDKFQFQNGAVPTDLHRAEFYLQFALEQKGGDYRVLNDKGKIEAEIHHNHKAAEALWRQSMTRDPGQQRAYYNLGTMKFELGDLDEAIRFLRDATGRVRWEEERNEANEGNLYYNLACSLWRKEVKDGTRQPDGAIGCLKKAVQLYPKLRVDISGDKDLNGLAAAVGGEQQLLNLLPV